MVSGEYRKLPNWGNYPRDLLHVATVPHIGVVCAFAEDTFSYYKHFEYSRYTRDNLIGQFERVDRFDCRYVENKNINAEKSVCIPKNYLQIQISNYSIYLNIWILQRGRRRNLYCSVHSCILQMWKKKYVNHKYHKIFYIITLCRAA